MFTLYSSNASFHDFIRLESSQTSASVMSFFAMTSKEKMFLPAGPRLQDAVEITRCLRQDYRPGISSAKPDSFTKKFEGRNLENFMTIATSNNVGTGDF